MYLLLFLSLAVHVCNLLTFLEQEAFRQPQVILMRYAHTFRSATQTFRQYQPSKTSSSVQPLMVVAISDHSSNMYFEHALPSLEFSGLYLVLRVDTTQKTGREKPRLLAHKVRRQPRSNYGEYTYLHRSLRASHTF